MRGVPPKGSGRDRDAEIGAALAAVTGGGAVRVGTGGAPPERRVVFAHAGAPAPWLPFTAAPGELHADGEDLFVGLGPAGDPGLGAERVRCAGTSAGARLAPGRVGVVLPAGGEQWTAAAVDGLASGYPGAEPVELVVEEAHAAQGRDGLLAAEAVRLARLLTSAPPNVLTPERAAGWAAELAGRAGLRCHVRGPAELAAEGFGALLAIGAGSGNGPRLVELELPAPPGAPTVALVGKGITFDSGGLSLKSPAAMQSMRMDVGGAAAVLAVLAAAPRAGLAVGVRAVLPFAENLPGPGATRPGDVVTAWDGTQLQILDTDFEGRVVLADALALAAVGRPALLVDLATLTYQAEIALGPEIAAVLGRDDTAVRRLLAAADSAGEPMWPLPWAPRYLDQVRTPFGVRNHPLTDTGRALTAALFLGEFVPEGLPWAHCDMSGPAWAGNASVDGGTGFGVRTLLNLLRAY